jgi:hypothetical protein
VEAHNGARGVEGSQRFRVSGNRRALHDVQRHVMTRNSSFAHRFLFCVPRELETAILLGLN